ncbi:MAG: FMN-binding negative transcriptional regulator [Alphaproteobacteria bacterium]|nr:FMN-binding negative transcriptional regulator [Alphaproteobacteria bacterium]
MYLPEHFEEKDPSQIRQLVDQFPLATLVANSKAGLTANHLPLQFNGDRELFGHIALHNDMHEIIPDGAGPANNMRQIRSGQTQRPRCSKSLLQTAHHAVGCCVSPRVRLALFGGQCHIAPTQPFGRQREPGDGEPGEYRNHKG